MRSISLFFLGKDLYDEAYVAFYRYFYRGLCADYLREDSADHRSFGGSGPAFSSGYF